MLSHNVENQDYSIYIGIMLGLDDPAVFWTALGVLVALLLGIWQLKKKDPARLKAKKIEAPVLQDSQVKESPMTGKVEGGQTIVSGGKNTTVNEGDNSQAFKYMADKLLEETKKSTLLEVTLEQKDLEHKAKTAQSEEEIKRLKAEIDSTIEEKPNPDEHWKKAQKKFEEGDYTGYQEELDNSMADQLVTVAQTFYLKAQGYEAELKYQEALKAYQYAQQLQPNEARYLNALGYFLDKMALHNEAIESLEAAVNLLRQSDDHQQSEGTVLNNLGAAWRAKGEYDKAIDYYEQALVIDRKVFGAEHPNTAIDLNNLGGAWKAKGEYDKAIDYYEQALKIDRKVLGEKHSSVARELNNLGTVWNSKGKYDKAIDYFEQALTIVRNTFSETHPFVAVVLNNLGSAWKAKGESNKAIDYYEQALVIDSKIFGEEHPDTAVDLNNLGSAWDSKGDYDKAISYYEQALVIDRKVLGEEHPDTAVDYLNLGVAYYYKKEYTMAVANLENAAKTFIQFLGEEHPQTIGTKSWLQDARQALAAQQGNPNTASDTEE